MSKVQWVLAGLGLLALVVVTYLVFGEVGATATILGAGGLGGEVARRKRDQEAAELLRPGVPVEDQQQEAENQVTEEIDTSSWDALLEGEAARHNED